MRSLKLVYRTLGRRAGYAWATALTRSPAATTLSLRGRGMGAGSGIGGDGASVVDLRPGGLA